MEQPTSPSRKRSGSGPRQIRLEASSFCQLRCPSCPTTGGFIHPAIGSGFLRYDDFRKLVDDNRQLERIELSNYGEALLNPELLMILEYAQQSGVAITLENGVNLNQARPSVLEGLVKYQVRSMTCSIDGARSETYRKYRVRGDFDRVIANIEAINGYKTKHQSKVPALCWQFVVFGYNEQEISLAREHANKLGMSFRTKLNWDPGFSPIRDAELVRRESGQQAATRAEYENIHGEKYLQKICHQLWDDPQINWDGKVIGCCRNFWQDFGGNAFTDGLARSLTGEKINYARKMLRGLAPPRSDIPCTSCEMYKAMRDRARFLERPDATGAPQKT
jgi:MoaA/NifB/PqqE/SkfB family radical SAM enzyme